MRILGCWAKFNVVGWIGAVVQLAVLAVLVHVLQLNYLLATSLAVEAAILNNFAWHEHWTWSDRTGDGMGRALKRLVRFNLSTGAVSIAGNAALMAMLVDWFSVHYLVANLIAITACSILNFLVSRPVTG